MVSGARGNLVPNRYHTNIANFEALKPLCVCIKLVEFCITILHMLDIIRDTENVGRGLPPPKIHLLQREVDCPS